MTAQRYRLHPSRRTDGKGYDDLAKPFQYLALYEIDRDPLEILKGIEERARRAHPVEPGAGPRVQRLLLRAHRRAPGKGCLTP